MASALPERWGTIDALLIWAIGEVIAIVFVARVLSKGGSPAATISWILLILAAPYVGLVLYYLLPRSVQMRRLRRRKKNLAWIESSLDELLPPPESAKALADPLHRLLVRLDPESVTGGNRLALLETGVDFFERAMRAIGEAAHHVHLVAYIFRADGTGRQILRALADAARRGVEVRLLYDALGSWSLKRADLAELRAAGGRAEASIPLLWKKRPLMFNLRNHRKLLIADARIAFLGGRNVGDEYAKDRFGKKRQWLDTMLAVQGPAVLRLSRIFVEDWWNATSEDLARRAYFPEAPPAGSDVAGIVAGGPDSKVSALFWTMFQMIAMAESAIEISTPYLVPHPTLLTALQVAAGRGVRVRVHTNGRVAAETIVYQAARAHYRALLEAGASVYETQGDYNHAKLILVDRKHLFVGSPNLDMRSTDLNFEVGAVTSGVDVVEAAQRMFEKRCGKARRITLAELPAGFFARIIEGIARIVSPLL